VPSLSDDRQPDQPQQPEAPRREPLPQFDWLTEVAIPICVFGLLGSLLYYLIEVRATLAGQYSVGPLRWVVFWFLLACIGITRIRTKYGGAAIAGYYTAMLAGAIALFVWVYTGRAGAFYGGANEGGHWQALLFNWALVGVVWWAAHAVTREATLEENVRSQLEGGLWTLLADEWQYPDPEDREPDEDVDQAKVRPRHPGRLVLWVSLAALLLFAVGQRTIGGEGQHARVAFWCMSAYLLFALLLLALTNLSALRMQVRRRGISLAPAVTPAWIVTSAILVVAIVIFSARMPRSPTPAGETRIVQVPEWLSDAERPGVEEGPAEGLGPRGDRPGGEEQGAGGEGAEDEAGPGEEDGEGGGGQEGEDEGVGAAAGTDGAAGGGEGRGEGEGSGGGEGQGESDATPAPPSPRPTWGVDPSRLLMWLLLAAAALAVLYLMWVHRRRIAAGFRALGASIAMAWRRFLAWLSRLGLPVRGGGGPVNLPADPFVDIFGQGLAADLAPSEVVKYVYRAFQVYAARGGHPRAEDQTALEFLRSLPESLKLPDRAVERLTRAYVLATYSPRAVTEAQVRGARETWRIMRERLRQQAGG